MPTLAYITTSNKVTIIDTDNNTIVTTIPTTQPGDYAVQIAITPDGKYAYVTNLYGTVTVIDTCSNTVIDTINVGFNPMGIAITPNGKFAYVANAYESNVSVIDTTSNTVIDTVPVGRDPLGVAITPDGNFIYVTIAQEDNVSVIDTSSNTVVDTIPVGFFPHGIAITPDGRFAYVSNNEQPPKTTTVSVINIALGRVVRIIPVGFVATTIAITPDGKYAYVANAGDDNVSVIEIDTNTVIETIPVGSYDYGVAVTPDGLYAYVANAGDDNISVIDTTTNTVVDTIPVGNGPFGIAIADIAPCASPSDKMCIETTRIFDSCIFEEERNKTFKIFNEDQEIECKVIETKCCITNVTIIDEQENLADIELHIKVYMRFTNKKFKDYESKEILCFDKNITLIFPEGAKVCCDVNSATCECVKKVYNSCNHRINCTIKVVGIVKSKKQVQIEIPFLQACKPRQCCPDEGIKVEPGECLPLPNQLCKINKIMFSAKTKPGMNSRLGAFVKIVPFTFKTVSEELKHFEIDPPGGLCPIENISIKNIGKSTVYVYDLTTE